MPFRIFKYRQPFALESGIVLPRLHLGYTVHGAINEEGSNVIWIFHALTANSDPMEWWPGLVGKGRLFDPSRFLIICVNMPGSCYGSVDPLDMDPVRNRPYYHEFPWFTTRDMVRAYDLLRASLGIRKIHIGIGGSMGGQQLLEWAIESPLLFEYIFPIATNAQHSPWGIAFNASQRMSIEADPSWKKRCDSAGTEGMKVARSIALISYRHYDTYTEAQAEATDNKTSDYKSESYQRYQGEKLAKRFTAFSYYFLSKAMDAHHVGRDRGGIENALKRIKAKALVIGIETDMLFPLAEQKKLAKYIPGAAYRSIHSPYGHDGFLLEFEQIEQCITTFLLPEKSRSGKLAIRN